MTKPKVVFDTNIYLSAIVFGGTPRKVLKLALEERIFLYTSAPILLEVATKLKRKFLWSDRRVNQVIKSIAQIAILVKPKRKLGVVKADPSDNKILEAAVAAKANFLVTGDRHLLEIKEFRGIEVVNSRNFLKLLRRIN
jgi:putative PIN family toxin of toxin-antitoxin system